MTRNHYRFLAEYAGVRQLTRVLMFDTISLSITLTVLFPLLTHFQKHRFELWVLALATVYYGLRIGFDIQLLVRRTQSNRRDRQSVFHR